MYWLVTACLVLTSCGRLEFGVIESRSDAGVDVAGDTPLDEDPDELSIRPASFVTNSPTFVDIPDGTLVVPASPAQQWVLFVSASLSSSSNHYAGPEARYLVDGVERGIGGTENYVTGLAGPWQHFYVFDGGTAPTTIQFQARDVMSAQTTVSNLRAAVLPLPVGAVQSVAFDAATSVTSQTMTPLLLFPFNFTQAGDYLFLLLANATESPSSSDIRIQWFDPSGAAWSSSYQNPRGAWQSSFLMRRAYFSDGPGNVVLQASSGASATVAYARVAALHIDAFAGRLAFAETSTDFGTTSDVPMEVLAVSNPPLPASSAYISVGTLRVDDDCANMVEAQRTAVFSLDSTVQISQHATDNCAAEQTYGFVDRSSVAPGSFTAAFASANTMIVQHEESALLVLGVP